MHDSAPLRFDDYPQTPHGGHLVDQVVPPERRNQEIEQARSLPAIMVDLQAVITIEMICTGVLSPNKGFMNQADYLSSLEKGRLADGTIWPVPLSFAPVGRRNAEIIGKLSVGDSVALVDHEGNPVARLEVNDLFDYDREHRAKHLFGTTDRSHPGVASIFERMGDVSIGGHLYLLNRVDWGPFEALRREPRDIWHLFYEERKFKSVAGFITGANPLHRGHEYIHRNALEEVDGVFLQPLVEMAKREFVRPEYRVRAYRNVLDTYYPKDRAILSPLRVTYIFAGPREAVLHALIMKNYGCTHALIGRDHAGIGSFYDKYAGHSIFDEYDPQELGISVRLFHEVFYCMRCACHATEQTCPHDERHHLNISGTAIREMLRFGIIPPKEVVRPESALPAMQGVQPKGVDERDFGTMHVGGVVRKIFPYYMKYAALGGQARAVPLKEEDLGVADLEAACRDVREHASRLYGDIYREYSALLDVNRNVQPGWITEARDAVAGYQKDLIGDLENKLAQAQDETSDQFMYQDRAEVERELQAARDLLQDIPPTVSNNRLQQRIWNDMPYRRYRGADEGS
ncbi:sulfate adenylyltransferase [Castellaniella sp.]|uniref:sulfate adenylyltransferase n=1 Tax=Castellaniella sp. TaxID=1955812 RepID=UPI00355CF008